MQEYSSRWVKKKLTHVQLESIDPFLFGPSDLGRWFEPDPEFQPFGIYTAIQCFLPFSQTGFLFAKNRNEQLGKVLVRLVT